MTTLLRHFETLCQVLSLPQADLHFDARIGPDDIAATYRAYTKPHPRYKLIRHKTIGAALIGLVQAVRMRRLPDLEPAAGVEGMLFD